MEKKIKEVMKKYNIVKEFKDHQDIVERYERGDLCSETDESGQCGFWDEAGYLATRGVEFGDHKEWDKCISNQDYIYYAFQKLLTNQLNYGKIK